MQAAAKTQLWMDRSLLAIFAVCLAVAFLLARPFLGPLLLASFLVAVCHRPHARLRARLGRPQLAAGISAIAVALALVLPAALFLTMLVEQLVSWTAQVRAWLGPSDVSQVLLGQLPLSAQQHLARYVPLGQEELAATVGRIAAWLSAAAPGVVTLSLDLLLKLFVLVLALYYLFLDGEKLVTWLIRISPLRPSDTRELIHEFRRVADAMLTGSAAVATLQALAAWLIFAVLGIPNALVWAMALAFASFVPAVGVALVYVPMVVTLFLLGRHASALLLLGYSLVVIGMLMDYVVRPQLVRGRLTMHPLVIFVAICGGVLLFGGAGLLLGPLVAAFLITVLRIYARDLSAAS
ncbi:MAG: AI-2E family transporter [Deltaproteobacteria bacterium]|nr:AI-2E family transporter [Deltaproteobacteria bacterium]